MIGEEDSVFEQDSWSHTQNESFNRLPKPMEGRRASPHDHSHNRNDGAATVVTPAQQVESKGTASTGQAQGQPGASHTVEASSVAQSNPALRSPEQPQRDSTRSPEPNSHLGAPPTNSPPAFQVSPARPPASGDVSTTHSTSNPLVASEPAAAKSAVLKKKKQRGGSSLDDEEQTFVNEWGFEITVKEREREEVYIKNVDGAQVLRREVKWSNMTAQWDRTSQEMQDKLKERCRKGIPGKLRGIAWQYLLGSRMEMESPANKGVYVALKNKKLDPEVFGIIERDLGRTFPTHVLFRDQDGVGQTTLRNILHAYANIDPEVGYVQGMGFLVGTLMTQMDEEEAFWALHSMMHTERYRLRDMYRPGFPMLQLFFFQLKKLMHQHIPKLFKRFEDIGVDPSFFASQWFLTLFVYHFQFRALLLVWDIFLCEGWKQIFRVAIALMKWEEKELLEMPFDAVLPRLKTLHENKNPDEILARSLQIKFKTEQLAKWRTEYEDELRSGARR